MLSINELKKGTNITLNGEPFTVIFSQHLKMGRGGGIMQTKLQNLLNGKVIEKNFKGQETVESAELARTAAQFLYADSEGAHFMDQESFETITLPEKNVAGQLKFIQDGMIVDILNYNGKAISVSIPVKVDLQVRSTPPGVKGNTATGGTKPATLVSGAVVNVPLFINEGDIIRVNTETGEYVERAG